MHQWRASGAESGPSFEPTLWTVINFEMLHFTGKITFVITEGICPPNGPGVPSIPSVPSVSYVPLVHVSHIYLKCPRVTNGPCVPNVPCVSNGPYVPSVPNVPYVICVSNVPYFPNILCVSNGPCVPNVSCVLNVPCVPNVPNFSCVPNAPCVAPKCLKCPKCSMVPCVSNGPYVPSVPNVRCVIWSQMFHVSQMSHVHSETQVSGRLGMSWGRSPRHAQNPLSGERRKTLSITHHALSPPPSYYHLYIIHFINWLQRFYRITMSLKRPFVPKSDVKQWFTTTHVS